MPNVNSVCNNLGNIFRNISNSFQNPHTNTEHGPSSSTSSTSNPSHTNLNANLNSSNARSEQEEVPSAQTRRNNNTMNPFEEFLAHAFYNPYAYHAATATASSAGPIPPETQPHPPASTKTIRQLPTVSVTPEDLVDENNRECCICFEEHHIHDKVSRLPCAHIYHPSCIVQWLVKNNTCPQCRYELPTDNVVYERVRQERMKARKLRYAKYELQRMHNKDLKDLCLRLGIHVVGVMEKREYIDLISKSGKVDMIASPDPVEYDSIQDLRKMGVSVLKKNMMNAGVFFDPKDVVEKEDMVQIFINSGRIVFRKGIGDNDDEDEQEERREREEMACPDSNMTSLDESNVVQHMEGASARSSCHDNEDGKEMDDIAMTDIDTVTDNGSKRPRIVPSPVQEEPEIYRSSNSSIHGDDISLQPDQVTDEVIVLEHEPEELEVGVTGEGEDTQESEP